MAYVDSWTSVNNVSVRNVHSRYLYMSFVSGSFRNTFLLLLYTCLSFYTKGKVLLQFPIHASPFIFFHTVKALKNPLKRPKKHRQQRINLIQMQQTVHGGGDHIQTYTMISFYPIHHPWAHGITRGHIKMLLRSRYPTITSPM